MENLRVVLANLLPLLNGIHSLECNVPALAQVKQCFGEKLNKIKELTLNHFEYETMDEMTQQTTADFIMDWLNSPGQNGPKLCDGNGTAFGQQIWLAIREVVCIPFSAF